MSFFTLTSNTATAVLSNSAFQSVWVDPYDPQSFYYSNSGTGGKISEYNIATDTVTDHYSGGVVYKMIQRSYAGDGGIYSHTAQTIVSLADISSPVTIFTGTEGTIQTIAVSADGTLIYYTVQNNVNMKAFNISSGTTSDIYTHTVAFGSVTLETDPTDATYLYFVDANDEIYSLNISLGTIVLLAASPIGNNCKTIKAMDGSAYIAPWNQTGYGLIKIDPDGTNEEIYTVKDTTKILLLDTVNKKIYTFDFGKNIAEFSVPLLGELPPYVPPPSISGTPSSVYIDLTWTASNTYYRLDLTDSISTVTVTTGIEDLTYTANNLTPETSYTVELYTSSDDITYSLQSTITITTLENIRANFDESLFFSGSDYDFGSLDYATLTIIEELFNEIFTTADNLTLKDSTGVTYNTSFVNLGSIVDISDSSAFYLPFSGTDPGQEVFITLSDTSTTTIAYDQTTGSVNVGGITYFSGQSFKLDGKTVYLTS